MFHLLSNFKPLDYQNDIEQIKTLPGNQIINLVLKSNSIVVKSSSLKAWIQGDKHDSIIFDYINFYLNYLEALYNTDNSYHLQFQICYFELIPKLNGMDSEGYKYRNIKQNFNIKAEFDQIIAVTTYHQMYFLYIIWPLKKQCYILDVQTHPSARMNDHQLVCRQLLAYFSISVQCECLLLKQLKQDVTPVTRGALILNFLYKYIESENEVQKIETIKIGQSDSNLLINKITWFIYKCYKDKIYLYQRDQEIIIPKLDKIYQYDEWQQNQKSYQNSIQTQRKQLFLSQQQQLQSDNSNSKSLFKSIASNSILAADLSSIEYNRTKSEINAQSFLNRLDYKELPKYSLKDQGRVQNQPEESKILVTKQELNQMMADIKKQVKEDVIKELKWEQEDILKEYEEKLKSKYNQVDEEIAQEYLAQAKFLRYKEYLQYLMEYNLNYNPQEYDNLLKEYNQRLKDTAITGLAELQKQELLRLQNITKKRIDEQNKLIDLARFNQQQQVSNIQKIQVPKQSQLKLQKSVQNQLIDNKSKARYQFSFAQQNDVNPYQFKANQEVEKYRQNKYPFLEQDLSQNQIEQIENQWKFEETPSESQIKRDFEQDLKRMSYIYGPQRNDYENRPAEESFFDNVRYQDQLSQQQSQNESLN